MKRDQDVTFEQKHGDPKTAIENSIGQILGGEPYGSEALGDKLGDRMTAHQR
ncbi:MAG: hypothetical protein NVS9B15_02900 [Acidobacteriaceae bacterium]